MNIIKYNMILLLCIISAITGCRHVYMDNNNVWYGLTKNAIYNSDIVVLCDAYIDVDGLHFMIRDIWRKNPKVLEEYFAGDEFVLPQVMSMRRHYTKDSYSIEKYNASEIYVLITILDNELLAATKDIPLPNGCDRYTIGIFGGMKDRIGDIPIEIYIRHIEEHMRENGAADPKNRSGV